VDGEDDFQVWKVGVNLLNKQSQTADEQWSLGLGKKLTPYYKKRIF
jgi:hypothetical protein